MKAAESKSMISSGLWMCHATCALKQPHACTQRGAAHNAPGGGGGWRHSGAAGEGAPAQAACSQFTAKDKSRMPHIA